MLIQPKYLEKLCIYIDSIETKIGDINQTPSVRCKGRFLYKKLEKLKLLLFGGCIMERLKTLEIY